jgi:hypothetical protein
MYRGMCVYTFALVTSNLMFFYHGVICSACSSFSIDRLVNLYFCRSTGFSVSREAAEMLLGHGDLFQEIVGWDKPMLCGEGP